ncbi:MAG: dihydropteroate synthase [Desulfobacterales bacterium]|jgi:cobalamin-dependent methionine synthase I|nr:dihydropteroate synthase [Desulfobacterales bacterium]MDO9351801.1 dihydropteroate synthase [Deltaproteobacteria bacterium]MDP2973128.1 dihydropteroate synthase [Deltaproteobacteria bacterium]MDP3016824.1 dihydropteroate synthase [Deltaproteobacteria bacterium]
MILIGESIHILSKVVSDAIKARDEKPLQELAIKQANAGADYIDLNVGPARKDPDVMKWLAGVIQEVVKKPLSLDTTNPVAMEAGLSVCKIPPLINSASGKQESKEKMLPLAAKYNCDVVLSVLIDAGIPTDSSSRAEAIMETVAYANEIGIPNERIWVDPIMMPISVDQPQVVELFEFMKILQDVCPEAKSTLGLSNLSNGTPEHLRGILNRICLAMLDRYNCFSAIVDSFDEELVKLAKGQLPDIKNLIYRAMDEEVDTSNLPKKEADIVKTVNVLMGRSLYSHSWLET